jgi:nuclear transport factor 2 (NTF2) superfamily protein
LIKENPDLSRNKLRKVNETLYYRLTRYDKEWVDAHSPIIRFTRQPYWEIKDAELLPKVIAVVNEMYSGKPERVLWNTVGGKLGIGGWFVKRKDKMQKVKAFLDEKVETLQEFQLRKLEWAIDELIKEGASVTKWNLLEKAGIKERYIANNYTRIKEILLRYGINIDLLLPSIQETE